MKGTMAFVALFYGLLAAGGLGLVAWRGESWSGVLLARRVGVSSALVLGLSGALVLWVGGELLLSPFSWPDRLRRRVEEMLGPLSVSRAVAVALLSGFGEEAFFRAGLQPLLGLLPTALLFGLLHTGPRLRGWTLFAVLGGLWFGVLYDRTGGVLAPALAHAGVNGAQLLALAGRSREERGLRPGPTAP